MRTQGAIAIATRSEARRGSPTACCAACAILPRSKGDGVVTGEVATVRWTCCRSIRTAFDALDRRLLQTIIEKFDGGPVGIESLAAAIGEERGTIEDVIEPYLIQQGFIMRTPRGRVATKNAFLHLGHDAAEPAHGTADLPLFGDD